MGSILGTVKRKVILSPRSDVKWFVLIVGLYLLILPVVASGGILDILPGLIAPLGTLMLAASLFMKPVTQPRAVRLRVIGFGLLGLSCLVIPAEAVYLWQLCSG